MRERDAVLRADGRADDDLVDVIELVPVLVVLLDVTEQRLKLGAARDGDVQRLCGVERLEVEQVEVVPVDLTPTRQA